MGKKVSNVAKVGARIGIGTVTGGASELARLAPKKTLLGQLGRGTDTLIDGVTGNSSKDPVYGDFSISPEELAANKNAILNEGKTQTELRGKRRQELADLLYKSQDRIFRDNYPQIAEDANSKGLYTGTGFSEALAREKARLAGETSDALSQQALSDLDAELGFRNNALSRQFSLEDFIRSANVAKTTGQALQPKSDGKAGTGAILSGIGAIGTGAPGYAALLSGLLGKKGGTANG